MYEMVVSIFNVNPYRIYFHPTFKVFINYFCIATISTVEQSPCNHRITPCIFLPLLLLFCMPLLLTAPIYQSYCLLSHLLYRQLFLAWSFRHYIRWLLLSLSLLHLDQPLSHCNHLCIWCCEHLFRCMLFHYIPHSMRCSVLL